MRTLTSSLVLLGLVCCPSLAIEVIKFWSTIAEEKAMTKVACKASKPIHSCSWHLDDIHITNTQTFNKFDNELVEVGSGKAADMCFLTISRLSSRVHLGDWVCEVEGECPEAEYWDLHMSEEDTIEKMHRRRRQLDRMCKSEDCSCWNRANATVKIDVVRQGEFLLQSGQSEYHAELDGPVSMTMRASQYFHKCTISFNNETVVEILSSDNREKCVRMAGTAWNRGQVCASLSSGLPSCVLMVGSTTEDMMGTWTFDIEANNRIQSEDVELNVLELPLDITMEIRNTEYTLRDGLSEVYLTGGEESIRCVVDVRDYSAPISPEVLLFLGTREIEGRPCTATRDSTFCADFTLDVASRMEGLPLSCGGRLPPVDKGTCKADFVYTGLEITKTIKVNFPATLVSPVPESEPSIVPCSRKRCTEERVSICDSSICPGNDLMLSVVFDSKPGPDEVFWILRDNKGRKSETIREGYSRSGYDAQIVQRLASNETPNRYDASMKFTGLSPEDLDPTVEHVLVIKNQAGDARIIIRFSADSGCACPDREVYFPVDGVDSRPETEKFSETEDFSPIEDFSEDFTDTEKFSETIHLPKENERNVKPFLDSCLALGTSILGNYNTDGSRRNGLQTERDFQAKIEDFFRKATCTGFDKDIYKYYRDINLNEPLTEANPPKRIFLAKSGSDSDIGRYERFSDREILLAAEKTLENANGQRLKMRTVNE